MQEMSRRMYRHSRGRSMNPPERREVDRRGDSTPVRLAHLEELVQAASEDIRLVRESLDTRVNLLEVGVRALEDWRLSQKVLDTERVRVQEVEAERLAESSRRQLTSKHFWLGVVITCAATISAALIASGHVF